MNTNRARLSIPIREMRTNDEEYARPATPPDTSSWSQLREAARDCTACHLYKRARQTVFGKGRPPARQSSVHPSALLRQPDEMSRDREYARFVVDLRVALKAAGEG